MTQQISINLFMLLRNAHLLTCGMLNTSTAKSIAFTDTLSANTKDFRVKVAEMAEVAALANLRNCSKILAILSVLS